MSLNLKNPRAYELASELSRLTGESLTAVVIAALEAQLAERTKQRDVEKKLASMLAFAKRFAAEMPAGTSSADHDDLYDPETGLPA